MRTIIADDEEPARSRLRRLLAGHPEIEIAGEARDGLEAIERIEEVRPDLLFLDIAMPGLTGFEVLQGVPPEVPLPLVIFVTGFDQHALAAFEANPSSSPNRPRLT
jgi:two-component system, LytTR family, response regulator